MKLFKIFFCFCFLVIAASCSNPAAPENVDVEGIDNISYRKPAPIPPCRPNEPKGPHCR